MKAKGAGNRMSARKPRVTSIDVARLAGVSQSAVSRAFTPGTSVSPAMRRRVLEAARTLNYVPNSSARTLITQRSNIVAMIVGDMRNPFYVQLLDRISCALQRRGIQVLIFRVANGSEVNEALLSVLQYQVDGITITSAQVSPKMAELCADRSIPVVMINRQVPGLAVHSVGCDNVRGGGLAARALVEAGGTRFATIMGSPNAPGVQDRMLGFERQLAAAGFDPARMQTDCGHYNYAGGYNAALRLFTRAGTGDCPDALFCQNDIMAIGAIDALRERLGLRIPDDVMVIGFDDIPEASRPAYRLTTIRQPLDEMIARTVSILCAGEDTETQPAAKAHFLAGRLIQRDTIRPHPERAEPAPV